MTWREGKFRTWKPKHTCECEHTLDIFHPHFGKCLVDGCVCTKFKRKNLPNKMHAKKSEFNGRRYDSGLESRVAADLEYQRQCGILKEVKPQFKIEFVINGIKITTHYVDFRVVHADDTVELVEAKGMWTPIAVLKRRLLEAVYLHENPGVKYTVRRG